MLKQYGMCSSPWLGVLSAAMLLKLLQSHNSNGHLPACEVMYIVLLLYCHICIYTIHLIGEVLT